MKAKDYFLMALVFLWTAFLTLAFQQSQLPGQYPIWLMFTTAFFCCIFVGSGFLIAGTIRKLIKDS